MQFEADPKIFSETVSLVAKNTTSYSTIPVWKNIILDYCPEEGRYITRRNMGTRNRRVYHYWSLENAYEARVLKR